MGNRVEDLEKQVAELQAAVDGLTEELVESKERLRQLEKANVDESASERSTKRTSKGGARDAEFVANAKKQSSGDDEPADAEAETDGETEEADDDSDGIIVA